MSPQGESRVSRFSVLLPGFTSLIPGYELYDFYSMAFPGFARKKHGLIPGYFYGVAKLPA